MSAPWIVVLTASVSGYVKRKSSDSIGLSVDRSLVAAHDI
jgi:hypothetical protein